MALAINVDVDPQLKSGSGCLILFGLPFLGGGMLALYQAFQEHGAVSPEENYWILFVIGGLFTLVGLGIITLALIGRRKFAEEESLKQEHPDAPWLWKQEWKSGRIKGSGLTAVYTAWGFAAVWNAISFPSAFAAKDDILRGDDPLQYLILLFPAIGLGLLFWAAKATLRYRKFGSAYLQLATLPGAIGGRVAGRVETNMLRVPPDGCFAALSSQKRVKRGKNSTKVTLWQDEQAIPPQQMGRGPTGVYIPIEFRVPANSQPSTVDGSRAPISWILTVSAELPGVDFETSFEVPVFATRDGIIDDTETAQTLHSEAQSFAAVTPVWDERIGERGGKEFYFRPARNILSATIGTLFAAVWGFSFGAMLGADIPVLFPVVWGFFELIILIVVLDAWTGSTRVTVEAQHIAVAKKILGIGRQKRMPYSDVSEVRVELASQNTQSVSAKAHYRVEIVNREGISRSATPPIKGKLVAREFARLLKQEISARSGPKF